MLLFLPCFFEYFFSHLTSFVDLYRCNLDLLTKLSNYKHVNKNTTVVGISSVHGSYVMFDYYKIRIFTINL